MYSLPALWLNQAERHKLDAFHAKALRKILHIPHSYYSRISNEAVFLRADQPALSKILLKRQLLQMGRIARHADDDILRGSAFIEGTVLPKYMALGCDHHVQHLEKPLSCSDHSDHHAAAITVSSIMRSP